jgi:hypothetical protein
MDTDLFPPLSQESQPEPLASCQALEEQKQKQKLPYSEPRGHGFGTKSWEVGVVLAAKFTHPACQSLNLIP